MLMVTVRSLNGHEPSCPVTNAVAFIGIAGGIPLTPWVPLGVLCGPSHFIGRTAGAQRARIVRYIVCLRRTVLYVTSNSGPQAQTVRYGDTTQLCIDTDTGILFVFINELNTKYRNIR
jgi:hypothetical protein